MLRQQIGMSHKDRKILEQEIKEIWVEKLFVLLKKDIEEKKTFLEILNTWFDLTDRYIYETEQRYDTIPRISYEKEFLKPIIERFDNV